MNIFITGASGFIGRAFLTELLAVAKPEWRIFVLTRSALRLEDQRVKELLGKLEGISQFREQLLECDYVFHFAANATYGNECDYDAVNYRPTAEMVMILKSSQRLRSLVFTSTIGAVDRASTDDCNSPLHLGSTPSPCSKYGQSKLLAERCLEESGLPFTIFRPTWVYGACMRAGSHINRFVGMIYERHFIRHLAFPGKVSLIHVTDLARALVRCLENPAVVGRIYFAETEALSIGDILATIDEKINGPASWQLPIPSLRFLIARCHAKLPLAAVNLFISYLWAKDARFCNDFSLTSPIRFADGVDDVISTNARISGYWVITGANSGIGLSLARLLARQGKRLVLIDRDVSNLDQLGDAKVLRVDLTHESQVASLCSELMPLKIACLVNNAGFGVRGPFREVSIEAIKNIVAVNALAPVLLTRGLIENLVAHESVIVNIASSIAHNPLPFMSLYSSTKAFLSNWSESLTYELRKTNLVITFSPSGARTGFQLAANVKVLNDGKGLMSPDRVAEEILKAISRKKKVAILGFPTHVLLTISKFLPRSTNITFWGKLFEKYR